MGAGWGRRVQTTYEFLEFHNFAGDFAGDFAGTKRPLNDGYTLVPNSSVTMEYIRTTYLLQWGKLQPMS